MASSSVTTAAVGVEHGTYGPEEQPLVGRREALPTRQWRPALLCIGLYAVLAFVRYGLFYPLGSSHLTGPADMDVIAQIWWLDWAAFAFPHVDRLFSASWMNYPLGQNFGVNGSMLALGTLFLPITKAFGPLVAWNVALRVAVVASATSMCLVLRRWTTWWPAAFVGGLFYGFSIYSQTEANYLFLLCVPLPPVIFLLLHEILVRRRWRPRKAGVLLGATCSLQFFISTEVLASTVVIGGIAAFGCLLFRYRDVVTHWRYEAIAFASSACTGLVLLAYPLGFTFAGPQHISGTPAPTSTLSFLRTDLLSSVVPSDRLLNLPFSHHWPKTVGVSNQIYLGLPLIILLVTFVVVFRKRSSIVTAGALALASFVLSLGGELTVNGRARSIALPFAILLHLPVTKGFLPSRFALYTGLFAAMVVAIGIDQLWRRMRTEKTSGSRLPARGSALACGIVALLVVAAALPLVPAHAPLSTPADIPGFFTSSALDTIPAGSVVLAYPYTDPRTDATAFSALYRTSHDIMLDQAATQMRFKVTGGFGWFPSLSSKNGTTKPAALRPMAVETLFDTAFLNNGTLPKRSALARGKLTLNIREFLLKYHVETIIVLHTQGAGTVTEYLAAAIGAPMERGGVTVWTHVQQRLPIVRS
jgi:hypothetical protein